jgi:triosephosphate isomerase
LQKYLRIQSPSYCCSYLCELASAVDHLEFTTIDVAAQNVHEAESGAFTGEISADMLKVLE